MSTFTGPTGSYKKVIRAVKEMLKTDVLPTELQKQQILALLGPLAAHVSREPSQESSEEESSDEESSEEESSDEESSDEDDSYDSSNEESEDECVASCPKRSYKLGERAKGRKLYKKNGGTEAKWRTKSEKFKDAYYRKYNGKRVEAI